MNPNEIFLCTICNVTNGNCAEDCAYCMQSARHDTGITPYRKKPVEQIVHEAKIAASAGALGFCLVTSGRGFSPDSGLRDGTLRHIANAARALKAELPQLHLIACNGRATFEQLCYLKEHGIDSYNHNLESAQSFFANICSTHTWEERFSTCQNALKAGLGLCCGGIFGLGESPLQREEMIGALKSLMPHTVPINFYIPHPALRVQQEPLGKDEALGIISALRAALPKARLMIAGGREIVFGTEQREMFDAGVNAIVLGDYLTTKGSKMHDDLAMLKDYGLAIATQCH